MTTDNSSTHKAQDPTTSNISFDDYGRWDDYARAKIAEIQKTYEITGDSKAADAAYCRLRDEREAREDAGTVNPPRDWLDGLNNLGTGDTAENTEPKAEHKAAPDPQPARVNSSYENPPEQAVVQPEFGKPLTDDDLAIDGIPLPDPRIDAKLFRGVRWDIKIAKADKRTRTAKNTARKRRWRAAVAPNLPAKSPSPSRFPVEVVTPGMKRCFYDYVSCGDTSFARSLRGRIRAKNLIIALEVYLNYAGQLGRDPTLTEFVKAMGWRSKPKAQRTVTVLGKVFRAGGFGTDADLAKWSAEHAAAEAASFPST